MNHDKSKDNQKSRKNYCKKLLSLILCAALILGIWPVPHSAQAAVTTETSAKIVVNTSAARYYHTTTDAGDTTTSKSSFDNTHADATASKTMMELAATDTKLTFSNKDKDKPASYITQMAYVPFSVDIKVPAYTTRTYNITFSLDYDKNTGSGAAFFAELIEGEVPNSFNTKESADTTGNTKLRLYYKGSKETAGPESVTVSATLENHTSSEKSATKNFVFFVGHRKVGLYQPRPTFNCTLTGVTYNSANDTHDTKTISFNAGGGSVDPASKTVTYYSTYGTLPTPTRTGYTFTGWYTEKDGGSKVESDTTVSVSSGDTLYAHWTANQYTVTFDKNGGNSPSQDSKTVTYDSTYGTLATVARTGYTFDGWYTAASGGTKVTSTTTVSTAGAHTLYAHWEANEYTVTFDKNGGNTPSKASQSVTYDSTYGTLATVTRTGYSFAGWYTEKNSGSKIESSTTVATADNHTLYAHWTANEYTITFSGALSGSGSQKYTYEQTGTIAFPQAVDQTGSGKFFTGWKLTTSPTTKPTVDGTTVNTSTLYQPGQALAFNGGALGDMTFTAQYTSLTGTSSISETLTISGRSSISTPPTKYTYTVKVVGNDSLKMLTIGGVTVTRDGTEDFVLTTTDSGSKAVVIDGESAGTVAANGTKTVTYKTLTVTVNANKAVTLEGGPELTRSGSESSGYTYTHTARDPGSSAFPILVDGVDTGKTVSYGATTALNYYTATATITAQSGATVGSVELVSGSKTLVMSASGSGQYTYTALNDGTTYTLRVNGTNISGQTTNFSSDKTLSATIYAKTITTKLNGQTADIPGVGDVKIGTLDTARTGVGTYLATQVGASIGTKTVSINGESVASSSTANSVVDYYTVTYDANGGSSAPVDSSIYLKGTQVTTLGQGGMAKDGCSFLKWNNGGTDVDVGEAVTVSGKTTLTAQWKENASCEVRWQIPGGEPQYGTLVEALDTAGTTPDVTITVQDDKTASLSTDHTLPESAKLIVPAGTKVVSDADGAVLVVEGRIENAGSFDTPIGTLHITESGKLINTGTVLWNIMPNAGEIDNTDGTLDGEVDNTDKGTVKGGTITGTVTGGTVTGPLVDKGTIKESIITGPVELPDGGKMIDPVIKGTVIDKGGDLTYKEEHNGTGVVTPPGGSGTGSTQVEKLIDALGGAAVESPKGTVKLVTDVDLTETSLIIDEDITIDLNGHTITGPEGKPAIQIEGGDVTITDSSDPDNGSIIGGGGEEGETGGPGIENKGGGTLTIEGGSVSGGSGGLGGDGGSGIKNTGDGDVVVKGGEIDGGSGGTGGSGIENTGNGNVNIENGSVSGGSGGSGDDGGNGVTNTGKGTVDVSGGEVTGGTGGRTGSGDGGEGGRGIDSDPDKTTIDPDASVSAGKGGTGGDGTVTLRSVTPAIDTIPDQDYTGEEITPAVVLRDGVDIIPASEYVVEYTDNIYAGTATVVVKDNPNKENALYRLADITTTFEIKGGEEAQKPTPTPEPTLEPGETAKPSAQPTTQPTTQPGMATLAPGETAKPSAQPGTPTPVPGETMKPSAQPGTSTPVPGETTKPSAEPGAQLGTATLAPEETAEPPAMSSAEPGAQPGTVTSASEETAYLSDKEKIKLELHSGLKAVQTGKKFQISWGRVTGADGYSVYVQYCSKNFNAKSLNQVRSGNKTKITVKKVNGKKLDTTKNYKLYVVAWQWKNEEKITLAETLTMHIAGRDSVKYSNVKKIQVKKNSYTLKKGDFVTLRPKVVLFDKWKKQLSVDHTKEFRYLCSNKKVATVTAGGKVKAKETGECTIYVFAKNGCKRKIKIKVK